MKQLLIKIIKNPRRAGAALCRRLRTFVKKYYFWITFHFNLRPNFHLYEVESQPLIPESLKIPDQEVIVEAYKTLNAYGNFLGVTIDDKSPPWYEDVRLRDKDSIARFFSNNWYSTIKISVHQGIDLGPDIKVPWMLGRLNHVTLWAYAYYHTKDTIFLDAITHHLNDFIEKNPTYYGVQWTCTMEVALRAINIIISISILEKDISTDLKKSLHNSLIYHQWYIQNHWEIYDGKTNNHYLSNLVSYWWLCHFFTSASMHKQKELCAKQLITEVEKQQLEDGTFYEGSSAYHRLSTDLLSLALAIDTDKLLFSLNEKYKAMEEVDRLFEYDENQRIFIGDNDSSPILHPSLLKLLRPKMPESKGFFVLKNFGVDIYKQDNVHVTLRHHVYDARQPSGHFHDDCNSITLSLNKISCIVDPGTYVYTSSLIWRNKFRDARAHATCSSISKMKNDCFSMIIKEKSYDGYLYEYCGVVTMNSFCDCRKFLHERSICIDYEKKQIIISDFIAQNNHDEIWWQLPLRGNILCRGNDSIMLNTDGVRWQLKLQKKWRIIQGWNAPSYGKLEPINLLSVKLEGTEINLITKINWY